MTRRREDREVGLKRLLAFSCPTCGAKVGDRCKTRKGKILADLAHIERRVVAANDDDIPHHPPNISVEPAEYIGFKQGAKIG